MFIIEILAVPHAPFKALKMGVERVFQITHLCIHCYRYTNLLNIQGISKAFAAIFAKPISPYGLNGVQYCSMEITVLQSLAAVYFLTVDGEEKY